MTNNLILLIDGGEGAPAGEYLTLSANGYALVRPGSVPAGAGGGVRAVIADDGRGP